MAAAALAAQLTQGAPSIKRRSIIENGMR